MEELYKVITSQCKLTLCLQSGDEWLVSGQNPHPHTTQQRKVVLEGHPGRGQVIQVGEQDVCQSSEAWEG